MIDGDELRTYAQQLRKDATKEENTLWYQFLRTYPLQFKRQEVIGGYIVDFFCPKAGLVIELDGGQHYEEKGKQYDLERTQYLEKIRGLRVLRFSNLDVNQNFEGVCTAIDPSNRPLISRATRASFHPQGVRHIRRATKLPTAVQPPRGSS